MRLADYIVHVQETRRGFARRTGLTPATISRLCNGLQKPMLNTLLVIRRESGGAVTMDDFDEDGRH